MTNKLLLIDGYSLIYRSFWAFIKSPMYSPDGRNISAVFGFLKTFFYLLENSSPRGVGIIMDSKVPTFRHEMYPEYKATRDKAPAELHEQIPILVEIAEAMGIPVISRNRYEADDIIASLSRKLSDGDTRVFIVSSDKDLMQVITDDVHMLKYEKGTYFDVDPEGVRERVGVSPSQIIDYLALVGDSADNIPGVRGIGPKTAVNLLGKFGTLENIYENLENCPVSARKKLEEYREEAFLSRKLVTLEYDIPLDYTFDSFVFSKEGLSSSFPLLDKMGSGGLISGLEKLTGISYSAGRAGTAGGGDKRSSTGKGVYKAVTDLEELEKLVRRAEKSGRFALDIETDSTDDLEAVPCGFSISVAPEEGWYIPLTAGGKEYFSGDSVKPFIKRLVENRDLELIGHNFKYDYKVLKRWGVTAENLVFDTMIAAWLLDTSSGSYGMDFLAERVLNYRTIRYKDVVPKGKLFPDVELESAAEYAAEDADITFRFYESFSPELEARKLDKLFYDIEMPLVTILGDMELEGIRLLPEKLDAYRKDLERELAETEKDIYRECGKEFNINSTKQLQEILFTDRKLKPVKKTKTGYSTDIKVLELLSKEDVVPAMVLHHRSLSKLKSTYVDSLPLLINPDTGKIHTHLVQTGTATGRLSSRDPNLQNIPIRSAPGRRIREAFVASEGNILLSADYSQIELAVLAHLSEDKGLTEAFAAGNDVHSFTGSLIFGVDPDEVTAEQRRIAKTINFGVMYGMSAFRLSRELSIPLKDASGFIDAYFERYSGIKSFMECTLEHARSAGSVRTLLGRERRINGINSRNKTEKAGAERIAVNTVIQGSAADIVKSAMINISRRLKNGSSGIRMILQIHDELIFEIPSGEEDSAGRMIREEMECAVKLKVPLRVSIGTGKSWGEIH